MPIFEYECGCGNKFEQLYQVIDSDFDYDTIVCTKCGDEAYKVMSAPSRVGGNARQGDDGLAEACAKACDDCVKEGSALVVITGKIKKDDGDGGLDN